MYTLYYAPGAASLVVHWLLLELGVPFDAVKVDLGAREHKRPEYLALNPMGVIPTLLIGDRPVVETGAIVSLLAARHPEAGLAPGVDDERYPPFLQAMFRISNGLQPPFRNWFYAAEVAGEAQAEEVKSRVRAVIERQWDLWSDTLDRSGGDYVLGAGISAADFYLAMIMRWSRNMPRPATDWPRLETFARLMKSRPTFAELYRREGLTEWA